MLNCFCAVAASQSAQESGGKSSSSSSRGRKLSGSRELGDVTGIVSVVAMTEYVYGDFTHNIESSAGLFSAEGLQKTFTVIMMFTSIWGVGLLALGLQYYHKRANNVKIKAHNDIEAVESEKSGEPSSMLKAYIDQTIPLSFHELKSSWDTIVIEMMNKHVYVSLFHFGKDHSKKQISTMRILSNLTMLCFLLSLLYDLQAPRDDGSCDAIHDKDECLLKTSILDRSQTYCQWVPLRTSGGIPSSTCTYNPPEFTWAAICYASIVVLLFGSVINVFMEVLFRYLAAPTEDEFKRELHGETVVQNIGRRMSNVGRRMSNVGSAALNAARRASTVGSQAIGRLVKRSSKVNFLPQV
jgi:hypothetical protein